MRAFVIVLGVILSSQAWGHGVHATESGLISGLLHPMTGIDHILAAVGMGLWLSLHRFTPVSTFLYSGSLLTGVAIALSLRGMITDFEWVLAATLILIGLLLARSLRLPQQSVAGIITVLFSCHAYAHLGEMPASVAAPAYISGFFVVTLLLVFISAAAGGAIDRRLSSIWIRITGAVIAAAGVTAFGLA
jgi:urease accessory protein